MTSDLGDTMRAAVDTAPVRPLDPARLRRRARHESVLRVAASAAAVAVVAGVSTVAVANRGQDVAGSPPPPTCPTQPLPTNAWGDDVTVERGPADVMVAPGSRTLTVCHYGPFGGRRAPRFGTVETDTDRGTRIVEALNALTQDPATAGFSSCPAGRGETYSVFVQYPDGGVRAVAVERDGCGFAFNGTRFGRHPQLPLFGELDRVATNGEMTCPSPAFRFAGEWPQAVRGPAGVMVTAGPSAVLVCRYGTDAADPVAQARSDSPGVVQRLADALNSARPQPEPPAYGYECMLAMAGGEYNVVLEYPDGHVERVAVADDGCYDVYNGTRKGVYPEQPVKPILDEVLGG